jgi:hypothetical protein
MEVERDSVGCLGEPPPRPTHMPEGPGPERMFLLPTNGAFYFNQNPTDHSCRKIVERG